MKTAVVENGDIGGRCLNVACIPAKAVLRVADILSEVREAGDFGITVGEPTVDFSAVSARREKVVGIDEPAALRTALIDLAATAIAWAEADHARPLAQETHTPRHLTKEIS